MAACVRSGTWPRAVAIAAAVFGEPVTRDGITVIPVARIGFGGGAGRETGAAKTGDGGGGGGGAGAQPLGFIEIRDGTATYKPIRDPWTDIVLPLAGLLAGTLAPRLLRAALARRGTPRRATRPRGR
ncbi:spore germination protein GerW family protein [Streptomyces sp. NPDC002845]